MSRKIALFLFSLGLAASASANHMDELACREMCQVVGDECRAEGGFECLAVEGRCYMECMHY